MAAVIQRNIPLIITLISFVFSVVILFAKLEYNIQTIDRVEADVIRLDKEYTAIFKDLQYIKESLNEIKSALK